MGQPSPLMTGQQSPGGFPVTSPGPVMGGVGNQITSMTSPLLPTTSPAPPSPMNPPSHSPHPSQSPGPSMPASPATGSHISFPGQSPHSHMPSPRQVHTADDSPFSPTSLQRSNSTLSPGVSPAPHMSPAASHMS